MDKRKINLKRKLSAKTMQRAKIAKSKILQFSFDKILNPTTQCSRENRKTTHSIT